MLISELESKLKALREEHGDLTCYYIEDEISDGKYYVFPFGKISATSIKKDKHFSCIPGGGPINGVLFE